MVATLFLIPMTKVKSKIPAFSLNEPLFATPYGGMTSPQYDDLMERDDYSRVLLNVVFSCLTAEQRSAIQRGDIVQIETTANLSLMGSIFKISITPSTSTVQFRRRFVFRSFPSPIGDH